MLGCERQLTLHYRHSTFRDSYTLFNKETENRISMLRLDLIDADDIVFDQAPPTPIQIASGRNVTITGPGNDFIFIPVYISK